MTIHVLKVEGENYFHDVAAGRKPFEVRKDDREPRFMPDDIVVLVNANPGPGYGDRKFKRIGYVARGRHIPEGYCVFSLSNSQAGDTERCEVALGQATVSK